MYLRNNPMNYSYKQQDDTEGEILLLQLYCIITEA